MALGNRAKILIVEDDAIIAAGMEAMVEELGYWVVGPYQNLQDAVDHANADDIDFGLLDFNLGNGTDALPVVEALEQRGVPFAITSGTDPRAVRLALPGCRILLKPVRESELARVLRV